MKNKAWKELIAICNKHILEFQPDVEYEDLYEILADFHTESIVEILDERPHLYANNHLIDNNAKAYEHAFQNLYEELCDIYEK